MEQTQFIVETGEPSDTAALTLEPEERQRPLSQATPTHAGVSTTTSSSPYTYMCRTTHSLLAGTTASGGNTIHVSDHKVPRYSQPDSSRARCAQEDTHSSHANPCRGLYYTLIIFPLYIMCCITLTSRHSHTSRRHNLFLRAPIRLTQPVWP